MIGSSSAKREEPAQPARTETARSLGGLGTVPQREESPAEPAPMAKDTSSQSPSPQVPPARPYDSSAEELDVPDFLK